ncbi:cytochrome P450 [Frankia sp. AgB1.9]|uniref:cytochrome P450 n=1 Tax=unclassified Frankia TaxID=2632575 RepID=UPI001933D258|nr:MULTISPECIES: cytochrome P450 [unclassified Frankia]MBL7487573.1 cytochrome P450 [Frankia sp. AgW1.1]MBL7548963.1 cytochrome P450 [Frankia sp. AgB1.9]MBL7620666.1 cytochrome P450 [Frankia sp. AgB1.8]
MAVVAAPNRINVLDPQFYVDPWESYRWLRDEAPVFWDPIQKLWVISRYEDVRLVEKDGKTYSSAAGTRPHLDQRDDDSMINMDDPAHQEQRAIVLRHFTPRAARGHEEHVRRLVTGILDEVTPLGECEAIEAIASRLPAMVITDLLGYPREMWPKVRHWSEQVMLLSGQTSPDGPPHVAHPGIAPVFTDWAIETTKLITARRADPQDDLISLWAQREGWTTQHILNETILVLDGGAETTRTVIGSLIRDLALRQEQRRLLLERPELLRDRAVEEFIRWVSPILNMRRTATVDHELHGQPIKSGDQLLLLYGAANRDEREFTAPELLDVTREHNHHLAFGFGTHVCLGAHLARLEIRVMFEELLRRMPDWEVVDPAESTIMPSTFGRAYDQVRIRFTPTAA